jgi:hypothetical protein
VACDQKPVAASSTSGAAKGIDAPIGAAAANSRTLILARVDLVFSITVRNGKVSNIREYIDTQALARASQMDASGLA